MASPVNVQELLNRIFVRPAVSDVDDEPVEDQISDKVFTMRNMKDIRSQILSCVDKHYRKVFSEILEQNTEIMKQQALINQNLELRNSELRIEAANALHQYEQSVFEKNLLSMQLANETRKYELLWQNHEYVAYQLMYNNQASAALENMLHDMNDTISRLSLMLDISRSMSAVTGAPIAQMVIPPFNPTDDELQLVSPAAPPSPHVASSRAGSPVQVFTSSSPVNTDSGVPIAVDAATEIAQLKTHINWLNSELQRRGDDLDSARDRCGALEAELLDLKNQASALGWERQDFSDRLDVARNEIEIRAEHIKQLEAELSAAEQKHCDFMSQQMQVSLDLAKLRGEHDDLRRRLRIAEGDCKRLSDEKDFAAMKNKHLEASNKELKLRLKTIKEAVKAELKSEWDHFLARCRSEAEQISLAGIELAEMANEAQVKYYQGTTDLALKHRALQNDLRELRVELSKKYDETTFPNEPHAINQALALMNKQLKAAYEENGTLLEQLHSQDIFIRATDRATLYSRVVELEGKIEKGMRNEMTLKNHAKARDYEVMKLRAMNDELEARLVKYQQDALFPTSAPQP